MSITAKPFNESEKIRKSVFKSGPNIFCSEDINRHNEVFCAAIEKNRADIGLTRVGWNITVNTGSTAIVGPNIEYTLDISVVASGEGTPRVSAKDVMFSVPTETISKVFSFVIVESVWPTAYLVLIAKKRTVTFADNPAMSGILFSDFPNQLPSSDTEVYENERLELVTDINVLDTPLGEGEFIVGILVTFGPSNVVSTNLANENGSVSIVYNIPRYNATNYEELLSAEFQFSTPEIALTNDVGSNKSVNDVLVLWKHSLNDFIKISKNRFANIFNRLSALDVLVTTFATATDIANLIAIIGSNVFAGGNFVTAGSTHEAAISALDQELLLVKLGLVPVGACVPYVGSLANFNGTGLGLPDTPLVNWAIANGNNGTLNRGGRISIPYLTADSEFGTPGATGGTRTIALTAANLPAHRHTALFSYPVDGPGQTLTDLASDIVDLGLGNTQNYGESGRDWNGAGSDMHPEQIGYNTGDGTDNIGDQNEIKEEPDDINSLPPYIIDVWIQRIA